MTPADSRLAVHVWGEEDEIPKLVRVRAGDLSLGASPMPASVIQARSKGIRTKKLPHEGWQMVRSPHAVVRGDISKEDLKATAVYTSELFVMLRTYLGGSDWSGLFSSRLFREMTDFRRAAAQAGAANAESYYDPRSAEIVMQFGLYPTALLYQRAFAHEFVHAYVDRELGKTSPLWLMEGVAEWFSNLDWRGDIFVPGQMNGRAIFVLAMDRDNKRLSLPKLVSLARDEMYGPQFQSYYAQAWSLIDWLMTKRSPQAVQDLIHGEILDAERYDEEWREHVSDMIRQSDR